MKRTFTFLSIVLIIACLPACKNRVAVEKEKQSEYYYYPKTNMYFDLAKNSYLFSLDGGKSWDSIDARTQEEPFTLGDKVIVYAPDSVWVENEAHRRMYGGALFNVLEGDTSSETTATVITEKKKKKQKTQVAAPVEEKPQKKGLKKFLSRIFGKKKDKKSGD